MIKNLNGIKNILSLIYLLLLCTIIILFT